jgi:hypothetical protein
MQKRAILAALVACSMLVVSMIVSTARSATAVQGEAIIAGFDNTADGQTTLRNTRSNSLCPVQGGPNGIQVCGDIGLDGYGLTYAVRGLALQGTGVFGRGVTGVEAVPVETDGNGVWGHTDGSGSGIYGENTGVGNGVLGYAPSATAVKGQTSAGTGVLATATSGTALKVSGKAQFSRSGTATITGTSSTPKASILISNVSVVSKSLILATPQKNVAGVWVQAAVPNVSARTITIFLNKAVTGSYPVAWFIVEKP